MRLFAALRPPPAVLDRVAALERPDLPAVRWTTRSQWHVTLAFFGEVPAEDVATLTAALTAAVTSLDDPVRLVVGPATERLGPGVLSLPVAGAEALAAALTERAGPWVSDDDGRPYRGHLTLARTRGRSGLPTALAGRPFEASWVAGSVSLVASELAPTGARYVDLATVAIHDGEQVFG